MNKKIKIKILSPNGHDTYSVDINSVCQLMEPQLNGYHVAYCEPMNKIVDNIIELMPLLDRIKEIVIIPKVRGGK